MSCNFLIAIRKLYILFQLASTRKPLERKHLRRLIFSRARCTGVHSKGRGVAPQSPSHSMSHSPSLTQRDFHSSF